MKDRFLHIVAKHQGIIHKVCRIYRDTIEDREDLFQEIVYQLWKAFPSFKGEAQPSTWMYKIALSTAVARYRKRYQMSYKQKVPIEKASYVLEKGEEETSEQKDRLYQAIGTLNQAEKAIIALYLDDYNYVEMADIIGISENYIGVKLNRIKEKLRKLLNH